MAREQWHRDGQVPRRHLQLMLDVDTDGALRPGLMLMVDDCHVWLAERVGTLKVVREPAEIPGGWWAALEDPFSNVMYVGDQSTATDG